jgi:GntR family transcriptional regulator
VDASINRTSKLPLYQQIYEILRAELLRGVWKPGDLLPTESDLVERFKVSRIIVRQAMDMLVQDGLIYRQRGKGTFASHPPIEAGLSRIISFTDDMRRRGFTPGTEVLHSELICAPAALAEPLAVPPGEELAHIQRLRLADSEPLAIEDSYLVHRYCPGILQHDYASKPLRETLEGVYGVRMVRARQTIRAIGAPVELAAPLGVKRNTPVLLIERTSFSDPGIPVELLRIYYRGDRYALYGELTA